MKRLTIMLIAGDPSGDQLGAQLARALLRTADPFSPRLIGAGGPAMAAAGVELAHDLTQHSVIGLEILQKYRELRAVFRDLLRLAAAERPDIIVGVDYGGFNLRFAQAVRKLAASESGPFQNWRPKLVQYVSPQVWASRPGRARVLERTHDLLLSILPFEPEWYRTHAPGLRVEFIGHPLVERHPRSAERELRSAEAATPTVLLLPGSRAGELRRHLPVMVEAARRIQGDAPTHFLLVLPNERLRSLAQPLVASLPKFQIQIGDLAGALNSATLALASTGTVTLECAWLGVPTVALYKTSRLTYEIGRRIVTVKFLAMPNLLAGEAVMPEFVQDDATPGALADAALVFLRSPAKRKETRRKLLALTRSLGEPGASERAARAIGSLV